MSDIIPHPLCDCPNCTRAERDRLRKLIDKRPAINAGIADSFEKWSHEVYASDIQAAARGNCTGVALVPKTHH